MASDLISRKALKDELGKRFCVHCGVPLRGAPCGGCIIETISEKIEHFPAVDAESIMYAAWKGTVCGRCGHDLSGWAEDAGRLTERGLLHYCPICGARMIGRKQDAD